MGAGRGIWAYNAKLESANSEQVAKQVLAQERWLHDGRYGQSWRHFDSTSFPHPSRNDPRRQEYITHQDGSAARPCLPHHMAGLSSDDSR